jgi:hypothetical protein
MSLLPQGEDTREPADVSSDDTTLAVADAGKHRTVLVDFGDSIREVQLA